MPTTLIINIFEYLELKIESKKHVRGNGIQSRLKMFYYSIK